MLRTESSAALPTRRAKRLLSRLQRRLKRSDFPGISSKTIARLERGDVDRPHGRTLESIARRLGVAADQIESY